MRAALEGALRGDRMPLYQHLARASHLPGVRANLPLAQAFASECASRGAAADALCVAMVRLDADEAPGDTALEFIPVCGVLALGARAAQGDKAQSALLAELEGAAEDLRFRVRDAVPLALARVGEAMGDALALEVAGWMDGYFQAAAVLRAMALPAWNTRLSDPELAPARLADALALASGAPRSAERYAGFKALLDAIREAVAPLALRLGVPVFDVLEAFARKEKEPKLRALVASALGARSLEGRFGDEIARVQRAFGATAKPPRDPRHADRPTRKRGGGRRR
jgi:hypothetical protein